MRAHAVSNRYPAWKNLLILLSVVVAFIVALPNVFPNDPAVLIGQRDNPRPVEEVQAQVEQMLDDAGIGHGPIDSEEGDLRVRFGDVETQLRAADALREELDSDQYTVAMILTPRTPGWLAWLKPMSLGLDLRGGVHFLFQVDVEGAVVQMLEQTANDFRSVLRRERIYYTDVTHSGRQVRIVFQDRAAAESAATLLRRDNTDFTFEVSGTGEPALVARMTDAAIKARQDFAIEQNLTTLRNRVDELGVAEPIVQRQGLNRIVVELPGVQDPALAERVLGVVATLQFHLVDTEHNPVEAQRTGRPPLGTRLYQDRDGNPVLLKRDVIVTGAQLTNASSSFDQGTPAVSVNLDAKGGQRMLEVTRANLNKPMAVLFIEQKPEIVTRNGEQVTETRTEERVISVATIRGVFSNRFQITGLQQQEANELALLLRAGALAAPLFKVEERTIGPSLGRDNIAQGLRAFLWGFGALAVFMAFYYRLFGVIADLALAVNVIMLIALLSIFQATLSLPGIAGILLTVGMSVDANVLINERIREELRNGNSPQAAIYAGYDKAFATILDSNITTLIAAIALAVFGSGPVRGFAVVLGLGILTSMYTAVLGTRTIVNLVYGGRRVSDLAV
jgi:preprotein translocase subunit SecD